MKIYKTVPFLFLSLLLLSRPDICKNGITVGLLLCGNTIIPALFPFAVCVFFLTRYTLPVSISRFLSFFAKPFHCSSDEFYLFLFSLVGGYPVGAKLLERSVSEGKLSETEAEKLLPCFIHSGPAFLMFAIGLNIYQSKQIGILFVTSQIFSAFLLLFLCSPKKKEVSFSHRNIADFDFADNFVLSTSEAATSVFSICSFVLIFSVITAYGINFSKTVPVLKNILPFFEVTCGINLTKNIYFIAFLIGFGGISVWFQIFVFARKFLKNYIRFILFRILHGVLFSTVLALQIMIFKPEISVYTTNSKTTFSPLYPNISLTFCLFMTIILLLLFLTAKKEGRNLKKDMI